MYAERLDERDDERMISSRQRERNVTANMRNIRVT